MFPSTRNILRRGLAWMFDDASPILVLTNSTIRAGLPRDLGLKNSYA